MRGIWLFSLIFTLLLSTSGALAQPAGWEKNSAENFLRRAEALIREGRPPAETRAFKQSVIEAIDGWIFSDPTSVEEFLFQSHMQGTIVQLDTLIADLYRALRWVSTPREALAKMAYDLVEVKTSLAQTSVRVLWFQAFWDGYVEASLEMGEPHPEVIKELQEGYRLLSRLETLPSLLQLRNRALSLTLDFLADPKSLSGRSIESIAFLSAFVNQYGALSAEASIRWNQILDRLAAGQNAPFRNLLKNYETLLRAPDGFDALSPLIRSTLVLDPVLYKSLFLHTEHGMLIATQPSHHLKERFPAGFFAEWRQAEIQKIETSPALIHRLLDEDADLGRILGVRFWDFVRERLSDEDFAEDFADAFAVWAVSRPDLSTLPPLSGPVEPFLGILERLHETFAEGYLIDSSLLMQWTLKWAPGSRFREFLDTFLVMGMAHDRKAFNPASQEYPINGVLSLLNSEWLYSMIERIGHEGQPRTPLDPELRFLNELFFESGIVLSQLNSNYDSVLKVLYLENLWEVLVYTLRVIKPGFEDDPRMPQWQELVSGFLERLALSIVRHDPKDPAIDRAKRLTELIENAETILHETLFFRFLKRIQPALGEKPLRPLLLTVQSQIGALQARHNQPVNLRAQCLELMLRFNPN
jgi:hypothetical protein